MVLAAVSNMPTVRVLRINTPIIYSSFDFFACIVIDRSKVRVGFDGLTVQHRCGRATTLFFEDRPSGEITA